ncbi:MAG: radical SAM protein [Lachnospiraceae bacterium]|nr:radical SAM protein [Lachnospiraceae bacterium]
MKEFTWENYDKRRILLCGPFHVCMSVLLDFSDSYKGTIYICDNDYAGDDYGALAEDYLVKCIESYEEKGIYIREMIREDISVLKTMDIRILSYDDIGGFRDEYVILVGKTYFKQYCKALGFNGLEDFYSAVSALKKGFAKQYYFGYFTSLYRKQKEGLYIGGVEIVLTKRCSLRCRGCANLMQYYDKPDRIPAETVIGSVKKLLSAVDGIAMFKLLGGEPLLEQDLIAQILSLPELRDNRKALGIQITTNGTILFREDVLKVMQQEKRLGILLSNYGDISSREAELKKQLEEYGIAFSEIGLRDQWCEWGDPKHLYHDADRAKYLFDYCKNKSFCTTVLDGRFYTCPRAAHGDSLEFYDEKSVDLLAPVETEVLREQLKAYYFREDPPEACARCLGHCGIRTERATQTNGRMIRI